MLKVIGMGADADAVYEALASVYVASFVGLSEVTGLSRERLRYTLDCLVTQGLVNRSPGERDEYVLADPSLALDVLLLEREQQLKKARIWAQAVAEQHRQAVGESGPARLVEIVTGQAVIKQRIDHVLRLAQRDICCFDKPPYILHPGVSSAVLSVEEELVSRGGAARSIYESSAADHPGRLADFEESIAAGEQARVLPSLPMKLILVDDSHAIVPLQAAPADVQSIVVVHRSGLLEAISALFESLWRVALPLEVACADPSLLDNPGDVERRILTLLTAGLPDESIARQLGLSGRTFQRRIHDLMERVNARTRFQLARQAARRGWLDDIQVSHGDRF